MKKINVETLGPDNFKFLARDLDGKTFYDGGIDEVIATRRLVHISNAFAIFGDRMKSIEMCVNRFDEDTKTSFLDLYSKIDAEAVISSEETEESVEEEKDDSDMPY